MRTKFLKPACVLTTVILFLSACNMTAATEVIPTEPPTSTATLVPTATATATVPTETPTETPTPTPSFTATPEAITAKVERESNCRIGPGGVYTLVATYQPGQMLEIVAKDLGGGYWFVKNPEKPEEQCYILGQNITISGDTAFLPQFTPQPSPTAAPYFEASLRKIDVCNGQDFAIFIVENVGSVPFRSVYVKVTDLKVNKTVEQALDAFDLRVACVLAKSIAPLEPGGTGYVAAPPFSWGARGNRLNVVLMLCTEKALRGTCVTRVFEMRGE